MKDLDKVVLTLYRKLNPEDREFVTALVRAMLEAQKAAGEPTQAATGK